MDHTLNVLNLQMINIIIHLSNDGLNGARIFVATVVAKNLNNLMGKLMASLG